MSVAGDMVAQGAAESAAAQGPTLGTGGPSCLLVVVEPAADGTDAGAVGDPTAAAARLILAAEAARLADALAVRLRLVTWPATPDVDLEALAGALAEVAEAEEPVAVLVQDGDTGRQLAPLIAQRLGTGAVLGCSDAEIAEPDRTPCVPSSRQALTFVKPVYGGWLEQEVKAAAGAVPVATLDLAGLEPPEEAASTAAALAGVEVVAYPAGAASRVRNLETIAPDARSVDLVHATRIVAAGMGAAHESLLAAVHELADLLEGSVGATRPVVDEGLLPKERLIGQTGRMVAPELYVALGISGSPHHIAGVRKADKVLSVNRDARAPIFQFSDVGYVADLEAVLPALIAKIKEWRDVGIEGDGAPGAEDDR